MRASDFLKEAEVSIDAPHEQPVRINTTIAEPATHDLLDIPLWIPPGQQTLELQKQQGGKASAVINQIVKSDNGPGTDPSAGVFSSEDDDTTDRAPEQSV